MLGRRPDGYHELETIFQTVAFADLITLEPTKGGVVLEVGEGNAPDGEANLAHRAATGFLGRWARDRGVRIVLQKHIPMGGGLGGGSSNAAAVLLGLREMLGVPEDRRAMAGLARELGADVPYFLLGGTALGTGRGDDLEPLPDLPEREVWLVTPPLGIPTGEIFGALQAEEVLNPPPSASPFSANTDWQWLGAGRNDLEAVVMQRYPLVRDVYNALVEAGATVVRLSGTGATLFAFFRDSTATFGLATKLPQGSRVVHTRTLTRSSLDRLRVVQ